LSTNKPENRNHNKSLLERGTLVVVDVEPEKTGQFPVHHPFDGGFWCLKTIVLRLLRASSMGMTPWGFESNDKQR
jgi:hypothetical protein